MADLTKIELQNLRHLITLHDTAYQKFTAYANNSVDPQIKQMFTRSSTRFVKYKTKIINIFKLGGNSNGRKIYGK